MHKYLITSEDFYTQDPDIFKEKLNKQIQIHKPSYVLYRDKSNQNYKQQAKEFVTLCKMHDDVKSFIHQDIDLAVSLGAIGVHLTSLQFSEIKNAKKNNLEVIISTHTHEEVLLAQNLGADAVTYSPIFTSPNKGKPKGIEDLKTLLNKCDIKVFALGGIVGFKQERQLKDIRIYGFASIRYFWTKIRVKI